MDEVQFPFILLKFFLYDTIDASKFYVCVIMGYLSPVFIISCVCLCFVLHIKPFCLFLCMSDNPFCSLFLQICFLTISCHLSLLSTTSNFFQLLPFHAVLLSFYPCFIFSYFLCIHHSFLLLISQGIPDISFPYLISVLPTHSFTLFPFPLILAPLQSSYQPF